MPHSSDGEILQRLFDLLQTRVQANPYSSDGSFAEAIGRLPIGLRAMAATHWLDISLTLDDIGWHFLNFGEPNMVKETEQGLRELGLSNLATWFAEAHSIIRPFLDANASSDANPDTYYNWLDHSGKSERINELSRLAWSLKNTTDNSNPALESPIYQAWLRYARLHPDNVFA